MSKILQFPKIAIDNDYDYDPLSESIYTAMPFPKKLGWISIRPEGINSEAPNDWVACQELGYTNWIYGFKTRQDAIDYLINLREERS